MKPSDVRLMKAQMMSVAETEEYQNEFEVRCEGILTEEVAEEDS